MAIIGEKITLDKPLVGNIARNQMESKMELATRGALYVGTGNKTEVTPDGGGDKVPIPETLHIAPNGASDNGKVLVADASERVGWRIDTCPTAITAEKAAGYSQGGEIEAALEEMKARLSALEERSFLEKIYGVDLVGSENPDALVRTDDAVGLNVTVGTSEITSDFDNCYPWCDMQEVTDASGNVFIRIPKFYSKITKNADGTYKHQLSGTRHEGFTTLFVDGKSNEIDYVLVGKYEGSGDSSQIYSKSGQAVCTKKEGGNFRTACKANGAGYQQYDFLIDLIIKELWLVEMKTTNSQSIMAGYVWPSVYVVTGTGKTDTVKTPSGSPESNTDGKHACKYRGIENLWGNALTWCDGISFSAEKVYVCTDPASYGSGKIDAPYVYQGNRTTYDGDIKTVEPLGQNPLIQYITQVQGGATNDTYFGDEGSAGGSILLVGGSVHDHFDAGLWCWDGSYQASASYDYIGCRLCYKPL